MIASLQLPTANNSLCSSISKLTSFLNNAVKVRLPTSNSLMQFLLQQTSDTFIQQQQQQQQPLYGRFSGTIR